MIMQNLRKSRGIVRLEAARCPDNDNQNDDNQNNDNQKSDNQKGDNHLSVSLPPQYGCCIGSICCFFVFYIFSFLRSWMWMLNSIKWACVILHSLSPWCGCWMLLAQICRFPFFATHLDVDVEWAGSGLVGHWTTCPGHGEYDRVKVIVGRWSQRNNNVLGWRRWLTRVVKKLGVGEEPEVPIPSMMMGRMRRRRGRMWKRGRRGGIRKRRGRNLKVTLFRPRVISPSSCLAHEGSASTYLDENRWRTKVLSTCWFEPRK